MQKIFIGIRGRIRDFFPSYLPTRVFTNDLFFFSWETPSLASQIPPKSAIIADTRSLFTDRFYLSKIYLTQDLPFKDAPPSPWDMGYFRFPTTFHNFYPNHYAQLCQLEQGDLFGDLHSIVQIHTQKTFSKPPLLAPYLADLALCHIRGDGPWEIVTPPRSFETWAQAIAEFGAQADYAPDETPLNVKLLAPNEWVFQHVSTDKDLEKLASLGDRPV